MSTLTNLNIWDGLETIDADTVVIDGDKLLHVGECPPERRGEAIDCAGLTLVPGLIDAHVHLELNPDHSGPPEALTPAIVARMEERAAAMARAGITTARDLGGGAWYELALRDRIAAGVVPGPRLLCSGQPITSPHGHCHFWGGEAADLAAARTVLARQLEHDVDLIKVMATGGRLTPGSEPTDAQFSEATLAGIVAMAHEHARPVAAHCHGTEGIRRAANAGVDTIEHCSWVGGEGWASDYQAEVAELILTRGIWVSPTVNKGWQRMLDSKTGKVLGRVREAYAAMLDLGIPLVASTDAGIPGVFHADLPHALVVFARIAQLSNAHALRTATSDAARALGLADQTGRIASGMSADLLVVDGDPLTELSAITRPVHVFCRGRQAR